MEITNKITNMQQAIHTNTENNNQAKLTQTNEVEIDKLEVKKSNQLNIDKQTGEDDKVSNEKEIKEKEIKKQIKEIVEQLNKEMNILNTTIRFGFDDKIDEMYVTVIDTKDDRVIRQIPSEEAMRLAKKMRELIGILFDEKG